MAFRFRKRLSPLPGFSLNFSMKGLSSLSFGGPGATLNVPVARPGGARGTVGLPGSGFSYTAEIPTPLQPPDFEQPPSPEPGNARREMPEPNTVSFKEWSDAYDDLHHS